MVVLIVEAVTHQQVALLAQDSINIRTATIHYIIHIDQQPWHTVRASYFNAGDLSYWTPPRCLFYFAVSTCFEICQSFDKFYLGRKCFSAWTAQRQKVKRRPTFHFLLRFSTWKNERCASHAIISSVVHFAAIFV